MSNRKKKIEESSSTANRNKLYKQRASEAVDDVKDWWKSLVNTVENADKKKKDKEAKKVSPKSKLGRAAQSIRDERDKYRK